MADELALSVLRMGGDTWNAWYPKQRRGADLGQADLRCTDLTGFNLSNVSLEWADLRYANLHAASLRNTRLRGAKLARANLRGTSLLNVIGLIQCQVDQADGDARTLLPRGLVQPEHWVQGSDFSESGGEFADAGVRRV